MVPMAFKGQFTQKKKLQHGLLTLKPSLVHVNDFLLLDKYNRKYIKKCP